MNDYLNKHLYPEARVTILQLLDNAPHGSVNAQMLTTLLQSTAAQLWLDQVKEQLSWLEEQKLVTLEEMGGMLLATITDQGGLVARGLDRHEGVDRPRREV